jgi:hypothetical protein
MMRHDETRARSEARSLAFREAAAWHQTHARMIRRDFGDGDEAASSHDDSAAHFLDLAAHADRLRAAHAPKPPVRYTEAPEQSRAPTGPWSASEGHTHDFKVRVSDGLHTCKTCGYEVAEDRALRRDAITDCVEDGWTTEHVTGWPDSYPFEALDPWPEDADVDGGRGGA